MKLNTTVTIQMNEEETVAWNTLYRAIYDLARKPCEDVETAEAINDFYEAMMRFGEYLDD